MAASLVQTLVAVGKKCAKIARIIRTEESFQNLTEEKDDEHKNPRFHADFKTLSDVLIQQVIKVEVTKAFPQMSDRVYGEENSLLTDSSGNIQEITIGSISAETSQCLSKLFPDNPKVAESLVKLIHEPLKVTNEEKMEGLDINLDCDNLSIWTDPLDGTAQYVSGQYKEDEDNTIQESGLCCVTILIGVYDSVTGFPVMGVITQPFAVYDEGSRSWCDRTVWGVSANGVNINSVNSYPRDDEAPLKVTVSASESEDLLAQFKSLPAQVFPSAGVGYKMLSLILNKAHIYCLSKCASYKWDTCAPQAILQSMGGGVLRLTDTVKLLKSSACITQSDLLDLSIKYNVADMSVKGCCNSGGLLAYCSVQHLEMIKQMLAML